MAFKAVNPVLDHERANLRADPPCFAFDLLNHIDQDGAASNLHLSHLGAGQLRPLDVALSDAAHFLSILHGTHPSFAELAEHGAGMTCPPVVTEWLAMAANTFDSDRQWLTALVLACGTTKITQGLTQTEQLVRNQRDAMLTLARSERAACALGAAAAMVHEWDVIRSALLKAAHHVGHARITAHMGLSDELPRDLTRLAMIASAGTAATRRALSFGARQLVGIHRTLWDLLEARHARYVSQS